MAKVMKILLVIGSIGAFIFLSACAGGNVWVKNKLFSVSTIGIWKSCGYTTTRFIATGCDTIPSILVKDWLKAVRAFAILSVLASIAAIVMAILALAKETIKGFLASICLFGAAGCMVVALAVYAGETELGSIYEYGWSYYLGWLGAVGAGVAGIIGFLSEKC